MANREFRFRAWNHVAKKMYYETYAGEVFKWQHEGQTQTIMQDTGLKDKNGKQIYEWDVVLVKGRKRIGEYATTIIYKKCGFTLEKNETYLNDDSCLIGVEVIGNIYEPESLLRDGKN